MKLYRVGPRLPANYDKAASEERARACIGPVVTTILPHLKDDPALFGMRHKGEISFSSLPMDEEFGDIRVARIRGADMLERVLLDCADPTSGKWLLIRSLVTCRAAFFGYDGQALVCVPTDAPAIVSADEALVSVEECSHLLSETDCMDGLIAD